MDANRETPPTAAAEEPYFGDLLRFLWSWRVRLVTLFFMTAGVMGLSVLLWRLLARQVAEGTLSLTFRGMERHEYPSGRKFSIEDIRSPQVLTRARDNTGLSGKAEIRTLYVSVEITPVIPAEIHARWRKQDRCADGQGRRSSGTAASAGLEAE